MGLDTLLLIAFLVWFLYQPLQTYLTNAFRQQLFNLRDDLFTKFSHDDTTAEVRELINAQIRFLHKMSIWRLLLLSRYFDNQNNVAITLLAEVKTHSQASKLTALIYSAATIVMVFTVLRSPFIWFFSLLVLLPIFIVKVSSNWLESIHNRSVRYQNKVLIASLIIDTNH